MVTSPLNPLDRLALGGSPYLDFRTYPETLGRQLVQAFALTHQTLLTPEDEPYFDTLADLLAARSDVQDTNEDAAPVLAQVGPGPGNIWGWFRFSEEPEGPRCGRPLDVDAGDPGRWIKQRMPWLALCGKARYFQHVEMCKADVKPFGGGKDSVSLYSRCAGNLPALFVSFVGDEVEEISQTQAFHHVKAKYRLRVLSENYRGGMAARGTAPRADEAAEDPGAWRTIGDLRDYVLKDNRLSMTYGLKKIIVGPSEEILSRNRERQVVHQLDLTCIVKTWTPNEPCELRKPWRIWLQLQDAAGDDVGPNNDLQAPEITATSAP